MRIARVRPSRPTEKTKLKDHIISGSKTLVLPNLHEIIWLRNRNGEVRYLQFTFEIFNGIVGHRKYIVRPQDHVEIVVLKGIFHAPGNRQHLDRRDDEYADFFSLSSDEPIAFKQASRQLPGNLSPDVRELLSDESQILFLQFPYHGVAQRNHACGATLPGLCGSHLTDLCASCPLRDSLTANEDFKNAIQDEVHVGVVSALFDQHLTRLQLFDLDQFA